MPAPHRTRAAVGQRPRIRQAAQPSPARPPRAAASGICQACGSGTTGTGQRHPRPTLLVEQAPGPAHGPLEAALPGLIEAFHKIERQGLASLAGKEPAHEARLLQAPGDCGPALAPGRRPAGLGDIDRQGCEGLIKAAGDGGHMVHRLVQGHGLVLPVGQDVGGDHIHLPAQDGAVAQPELPDVRIGHRDLGLAPGPGQQAGQGLRREFPAQQDLVADDQQVDHVGMAAGQGQGPFELGGTGLGVPVDPGPEQDPQAQAAGDLRDRVQPMVQPIGPHAAGQGGELAQVGLDAVRGYDQIGVVGGLAWPTEGGVGDAGEPRLTHLGQGDRPAAVQGPGQQGSQGRRQHQEGGGAAQASGRRGGRVGLGADRHGWRFGCGLERAV